MTYAGICYDGPLEGQHLQHETPRFAIVRHDDNFRFDQITVFQNYRYDYYVWSFPLRKWVFKS